MTELKENAIRRPTSCRWFLIRSERS